MVVQDRTVRDVQRWLIQSFTARVCLKLPNVYGVCFILFSKYAFIVYLDHGAVIYQTSIAHLLCDKTNITQSDTNCHQDFSKPILYSVTCNKPAKSP